jgi:hypothetical protein
MALLYFHSSLTLCKDPVTTHRKFAASIDLFLRTRRVQNAPLNFEALSCSSGGHYRHLSAVWHNTFRFQYAPVNNETLPADTSPLRTDQI